MNRQQLQRDLDMIKPPDQIMMERTAQRLDQLTKPQGSLGALEALAVQLVGITGEEHPMLHPRSVVVMAADHGVVVEGVSAYPQEVTVQMVRNFLGGGAAVNVLARQFDVEVRCADFGMATPLVHPHLLNCAVRRGTRNMAETAAMSEEEALSALAAGMRLAAQLKQDGIRLIATGEMGIGNTTASVALLSALLDIDPLLAVGPGTGLDEQQVSRKAEVIRRALAVNRPNPSDALDVLAKVGGLEIAGLSGLIIGAARYSLPIMLDGLIATAAALVAVRLAPAVQPYLIAAHLSSEPGHRLMLDALKLKPLLKLDMRLGEGTGAVMACGLADAAVAIVAEMATFAEAGVAGEKQQEDAREIARLAGEESGR